MSPEEFGFDKTKLRSLKESTIICAKVGIFGKRVWHTKMCHFVKKNGGGIEMKSRFWIGNKIQRMDKFGQNIFNAILNKPFVKRK